MPIAMNIATILLIEAITAIITSKLKLDPLINCCIYTIAAAFIH